MQRSIMEAYSEVDEVLNHMDECYVNKIPLKLRNLIKKNKAKNYDKNILFNKPLQEQNLKEETLSILAVLNYNYWCNNDEKRKQLINQYSKNEEEWQSQIKEKYDIENIFKNKEDNKISASNKIDIIECKESVLKKIINRIKRIFNVKK